MRCSIRAVSAAALAPPPKMSASPQVRKEEEEGAQSPTPVIDALPRSLSSILTSRARFVEAEDEEAVERSGTEVKLT